jgi:hypothetical protein
MRTTLATVALALGTLPGCVKWLTPPWLSRGRDTAAAPQTAAGQLDPRQPDLRIPITQPPGAIVQAQAVEIAAAGPAVGQPAPEITGEDLDGIPFRLSDYRGKVIVLDFWGDW